MTVSRSGPFRPGSVVSSARVRDKLKRRDKPYKTEQSKVLAKKRRIQFETSYKQSAPRGYVFLPVGTPDLAELCKELSRQRNLPVNVVNAKPKSDKHKDPSKVSHHIQRIGYHFQGEIVEQACSDLGYIPYENRFVKQSDLEKRNQDSVIGKVLSRFGVTRGVQQKSATEDLELVRASIKELFPRIPSDDLNAIVKRAWEDGTGRVGTAADLDLPRRVQLATIARIRHSYTDYDQLLRAFDWAYARHEVEPVCLAKLVEWRGEQDAEDNELEEIVRETIVIDDDDDDGKNHAAANTTDTDDTGNASDTSVEISHRVAAAEDLRVEDANERYHRYPMRSRTVHRDINQDKLTARAKLDSYRNRMQSHAKYTAPIGSSSGQGVQPLFTPSANRDQPTGHIMIGGRVHFLESVDATLQPVQGQQLQQPAYVRDQAYYQHPRSPQQILRAQGGSVYANTAVPHGSPDHPVPSIEQVAAWQRPHAQNGSDVPSPLYRSRPVTPEDARGGKRQRVFVDLRQPSPRQWPAANGTAYRDARLPPPIRNYRGDVVDLTTPPRPRVETLDARPEVIRVSSGDARYVLPDFARRSDAHTLAYPGHQRPNEGGVRLHAQPALAGYDPMQPGLVESPRGERTTTMPQIYQPVHENIRPTYAPRQDYQSLQPLAPQPRAVWYQQADPGQYRVAYADQAAQPRLHQAPVHGAPAPVQQMPREERTRLQTQYVPTPQYAPAPVDVTLGNQAQTDNRAYSVGQYYTG